VVWFNQIGASKKMQLSVVEELTAKMGSMREIAV